MTPEIVLFLVLCSFLLLMPCGSFSLLPRYALHSELYTSSSSTSEASAIVGEEMIKTGLSGVLERQSRPAHVGIPRKRIEPTFAIQMMRNSYNVVDDMDFVAMDEFQRTFFLFRQDEWEDYRSYHANVMQGDLAEALYFDFISFAQYAVIAEKMRKGKQIFEEKVGADGLWSTQIVTRPEQYKDNKLLPMIHASIVGENLLDFILNKYAAITPLKEIMQANATQSPKSFGLDTFPGFAKDVMDVFVINSYALSADIKVLPMKVADKDSMMIQVSLKAPANLWSLQVLQRRKDQPLNDFEIKVLSALARKFNFSLQTIDTRVADQFTVTHILKLTKAPS